jgi:hypothetical protein
MNSCLDSLGEQLQQTNISLGAIKLRRNVATPSRSLSTTRTAPVDILAARPREMRNLLKARTLSRNQPIDKLDFIGDSFIVASPALRSMSTVGKLNVKDSYVQMAEKIYPGLFAERPAPTEHREPRLTFWLGKGSVLRLDQHIFHHMCAVEGRGPPCFWCGKRPQNMSECLFCGEVFVQQNAVKPSISILTDIV